MNREEALEWIEKFAATSVTASDYDGPYMEEEVEKGILAFSGNYGLIAAAFGRSRNGVMNFVISNVRLYQMVKDIRETRLDQIEEREWMNAEGDSKSATSSRQFLLSRQGKDRGYATRQEQTGPGGTPVATLDISKMSDDPQDAARQYMDLMNGKST